MKNILLLLSLCCCLSKVQAQADMMSYGSAFHSVSNQMNPAFAPKAKVVFSLPGFSSMFVGANSSLTLGKMLTTINGKTYIDLSKLADNVATNNGLVSNVNADLLYVGFKVKEKGFLSLGSTLVSTTNGSVSGDILTFIAKGNTAFLNKHLEFGNQQFAHNTYIATHIGYAHAISEQIQIGGRLKILNGLAHANIAQLNGSLKTDPTSNPAYAITGSAQLEAYTGGIFSVAADGIGKANFTGDYTPKISGTGIGIDLGGSYQVSEQVKVSLAVNDLLGKINWSAASARVLTFQNSGKINYKGIALEGADTDKIGNKISALTDSIADAFKIKVAQEAFGASIGTKVFGAVSYQINNKNEVQALLQTIPRAGGSIAAFGVNYGLKPTNWLQLQAGYSWNQLSTSNVGLGLVANLGAVQLHFASSNINSLFQSAADSRGINLRMGLNFLIGRGSASAPSIEEEEK